MMRWIFLILSLAPIPSLTLAQPPPDAVQAHVRRLRAGDPIDRSRAAKSLGALGARARVAAPALVEALGDRDPFVARSANAALCQIGSVAVPLLVEALESENNLIRHQAAIA